MATATTPSARGRFIVFEGPRGAGKTTCLRAVAERLRASRPHTEVLTTREPTLDTAPGRLARRILLGEEQLCDIRSFQALCAADRLEHVAATIAPALDRGAVVLCDRYVLSSVAFAPADKSQGATWENPVWDWVATMNRLVPWADLTLVLCVDPAVGDARVMTRDGRTDALAPTAGAVHRFYAPGSSLARWYAHSYQVSFLDGAEPPGLVADAAYRQILLTLGQNEGL